MSSTVYSVLNIAIHQKTFNKCTVQCCTVLYCTVLYCTVLYCTVLYCTVLHCIVLCFRVNGHCVDSIVEEWTRLLNVLRLTTIRTKPNSPLYTHLIQGLDTEKVQEEEVD